MGVGSERWKNHWFKERFREKEKDSEALVGSLLFSGSVVSDSSTPWTAAHQASLSFTISQSLLKLMSIELVMPSNHLILCHSLLLLLSLFPSIRVFSHESALCIRCPKYRSFSFSISASNEYSGLISFRTDLLVVQGIIKSFLQHHNSKAVMKRSKVLPKPFGP